jgi:hypothetical protein
MKTREVTLATGQRFTVPQGIQRLDSKSTRGWQVRYQGTKYFRDGEVGPAVALQKATRELLRRIATLPAPVVLKRAASPRKESGLPLGITGPLRVVKGSETRQAAVFAVLVPRFGKKNQLKRVHIGTPKTYSRAKFKSALAKAIQIRAEGLAQYEAEATQAKRKEATAMKKALRAAAVAGVA